MADTKKTKKTNPEGEKKSGKEPKAPKAGKPGEEVAAAASKGKGKAPAKGPSRAPLAEKTFFAKASNIQEHWRLIDATGQTLGRLSSYIASALMGKDKPTYTPHADTGDHVIVINAEKVRLTGKKWDDKTYHYHTNYPGGIKSFTAKELLKKNPERLIQWAVWGMLPKGLMGLHRYKKLRVFAGPQHPHQAQKPEAVTLPNLGATEK